VSRQKRIGLKVEMRVFSASFFRFPFLLSSSGGAMLAGKTSWRSPVLYRKRPIRGQSRRVSYRQGEEGLQHVTESSGLAPRRNLSGCGRRGFMPLGASARTTARRADLLLAAVGALAATGVLSRGAGRLLEPIESFEAGGGGRREASLLGPSHRRPRRRRGQLSGQPWRSGSEGLWCKDLQNFVVLRLRGSTVSRACF